ncbi:MAG: phosphate ABC transporter permease PstA [Prochlorotrichaceae cyanobacterium]
MIDNSQTPASAVAKPQGNLFSPNLTGRYRWDFVFKTFALLAIVFALVVLVVLLSTTIHDALPKLDFQFWNENSFLRSFPSRKPERAGIYSALVGTIWLMVLVSAISFPLGVGAGIYLEEFGEDNWFTRFVEINISNLAGVPSIIYGLLGLMVFVRLMEPITGGRSVLSGALILVLLILPIIIVSTREALRSVPDSIRLAGFALGSTRWQVVREQVLPMALPGILTGMILSLSRAIGETAPLIMVGALTFVPFVPTIFNNKGEFVGITNGLQSQFTALPIQVYNWVSRPQVEFHNAAAAGIIVLLILLLAMNSVAVILRNQLQKAR